MVILLTSSSSQRTARGYSRGSHWDLMWAFWIFRPGGDAWKEGDRSCFFAEKASKYKVNCVSLQCEECVVFATNCPWNSVNNWLSIGGYGRFILLHLHFLNTKPVDFQRVLFFWKFYPQYVVQTGKIRWVEHSHKCPNPNDATFSIATGLFFINLHQ